MTLSNSVDARLSAMPRRGTPAFRWWMWRALAIGALPPLTAVLGLVTIRVADQMPEGPQFWSDLFGVFTVLLVAAAIAGFLALLDARTRVAGAATVLLALVLNPFTSALVRAGLGLA